MPYPSKYSKTRLFFRPALLLLAMYTGAQGLEFTDQFTRPNTSASGGGLGENWVCIGDVQIHNETARIGPEGSGIAYFKQYKAAESLLLEADFFTNQKWNNLGLLFNYDPNTQSGLVLRLRFTDGTNNPYWQFLHYQAGSLSEIAFGTLPAGADADSVVPVNSWRRLKAFSSGAPGHYKFIITSRDSSIQYTNEISFYDPEQSPIAGYTGLYFSSAVAHADNFLTRSNSAHAEVIIGSEFAQLNPLIFGQYLPGSDTYNIWQNAGNHLRNLMEGNGIWNYNTRAADPVALGVLESYNAPFLRYPGALDIHNFDWKQTIGPLEERPLWQFGLDEFMQICEQTGATPSMVVSEYIGSPQDAADLVEYLNAPAVVGNPWALKRAENGHPEPYGVIYFEIGNESWVDKRMDTTVGPRTAQDSAIHANQIAAAMKSVDPDIHCGYPYHGGVWGKMSWTYIGPDIDYIVYHAYPTRYYGGDISDPEFEALLLQQMLTIPQMEIQELEAHQQEIEAYTGRHLPISVTEYNMGPTQYGATPTERPYRHTYAAALANGDFVGKLLTSTDADLLGASYWQWLNGYFGSIITYADTNPSHLTKADTVEYRPQHYIHVLWGLFVGDELLETTVDAPLQITSGSQFAPPVQASAADTYELDSTNLITSGRLWTDTTLSNSYRTITQTGEGEFSLVLNALNQDDVVNFYRVSPIPDPFLPPLTGLIYKLSFEARWMPDTGSGIPPSGENRSPVHVSMQITDIRGIAGTGAFKSLDYLENSETWTNLGCDFRPASDGTGVLLRMTLEPTTPSPVSGRLEIQNLQLVPWVEAIGEAEPTLKVYSSQSENHCERYLTVFNLSDKPLTTVIRWDDFHAQSAILNEVTGASLISTNLDAQEVGWSQVDISIPVSGNFLTHRFPAYSASSIRLSSDHTYVLHAPPLRESMDAAGLQSVQDSSYDIQLGTPMDDLNSRFNLKVLSDFSGFKGTTNGSGINYVHFDDLSLPDLQFEMISDAPESGTPSDAAELNTSPGEAFALGESDLASQTLTIRFGTYTGGAFYADRAVEAAGFVLTQSPAFDRKWTAVFKDEYGHAIAQYDNICTTGREGENWPEIYVGHDSAMENTPSIASIVIQMEGGNGTSGLDDFCFAMPEVNNGASNILVCVADSWGWPFAQVYGTNWINTPGFNQIVAEGVCFQNAFTTSPASTPARGSLFTGRYPWTLLEGAVSSGGLRSSFTSYVDILATAGYHTGYTGKSWEPYDLQSTGRPNDPAGKDYNSRTTTAPSGSMSPIDYAANFTDFMAERKPGQPFCFWFGAEEPHAPYSEGSGESLGSIVPDGIEIPPYLPSTEGLQTQFADYGFEIEYFDRHLVRMLNHLRSIGELDNTLILVTGYHGASFPRTELNHYEYGIHVPMAVRWAQAPGGRVISDYISFVDIAPTLLQLADIAPPKSTVMHGKSILDLLQSPASGYIDGERNYVIVGMERDTPINGNGPFPGGGYPSRALRTERYLYVRNYEPTWTPYLPDEDSLAGLFAQSHQNDPGLEYLYKSYYNKRPSEELYDAITDPSCLHNLAAISEYQQTLVTMRKHLDAELLSHQDPRELGFGAIFFAFPFLQEGSAYYEQWLQTAKGSLLADSDKNSLPDVLDWMLGAALSAPAPGMVVQDGRPYFQYSQSNNLGVEGLVAWVSDDLQHWKQSTKRIISTRGAYDLIMIPMLSMGKRQEYLRLEFSLPLRSVAE